MALRPSLAATFIAGAMVGPSQVLADTFTSTTGTSTSASSRSASATTAVALVPPRPLTSPVIARPPHAPVLTSTLAVTVRIRVDTDGEVERVELIRGAGAPFDAAVLEGATTFRFEPARYGGRPVPVDIHFTQRFEPASPAALAPVLAQRPLGLLRGSLRAKGSHRPVAFANVDVHSSGADSSTSSDARGDFELSVPEGLSEVHIAAGGFETFRQEVEIRAGEEVAVSYLLEPASRNPFEVIVTGKRNRTQVAETRLRGRELTEVPGTFGDPFRVVNALPGVVPMMSLLPFPVVRGSSPGNTGFLLDGVRVPLLFHLLTGPSVVHPELLDEIVFFPGAFPVEYGGYTAGIVDGKTRTGPSERKIDVDLNLFQIGALLGAPIDWIDARGSVSGRIGYPGLLMSLASPRTSLSYWDYQVRLDGGGERSGYTVFFFGARDAFDAIPAALPDTAELEPVMRLEFHRLDLRYRHRVGALRGSYLLTLGTDSSLAQESAQLTSWSLAPQARFELAVLPGLDLRFGLDALAKTSDVILEASGQDDIGGLLGAGGAPESTLYSGGVLLEALWAPSERWLIRPGARLDVFHNTDSARVALDPRVLARYRVSDDAPEVWIKGGIGLYHQPPRFAVPVPGLDQIAFDRGLLEALQTTLGAELVLPERWSVDLQAYFNWMDPIFYDVQINPAVGEVEAQPPTAEPGIAPPEPPQQNNGLDDRLDQLLTKATGRAYGVEILVRRQSTSGVSGWISYTLSRSERLREGAWTTFDFDRPHVLNLVLAIPLPRRWNLGFRVQVLAGRPITTTSGLATSRTSPFVRFDLRIDKTVIWNDWLLDFYVDVSNAMLAVEELAPGTEFPYVLPTVGFRGMF
ncbi:MAG: TonB family protein [Deltaproteobacteria bacterium]|nr:TonB family protein [Deltaproteobacteria bacterium]